VKAGNQRINHICNWPNPKGANRNSDKTPSVVSREGGSLHKWGYDVDDTSRPETIYRWMKILLEPKAIKSSDSECFEAVWTTKSLLDQEGRTAVDAVGEYLSQLWKYTLEEIGSKQGADFQETYKLRVVLTVPALWTAKAKDNTLQAARRGGLPEDITMVIEPEAAALMVLKEKNDIGSLRVSV
jgi:molecular chaperone DnaK (HSP70)